MSSGGLFKGKCVVWQTILREKCRREGARMGAKIKGRRAAWMGTVILVSVASLASASSDLRLVEAVRNQDRATARSLLSEGVDVNATQPDGTTALAWAAHWDDLETADLLIRAGAEVNTANQYGVTPLSLASANGSGAMVEKLLQAGANPNVAKPTGETPLLVAARSGSAGALQLLLAHGADVNAKESWRGQTALMWAVAEQHVEAARVLVERGADIQARSNAGFTPLLFAARTGNLESVQLLLEAGGNVNDATPDGMTALVVASANGFESLAIFLLDKGADPNVKDGNGVTAMHYAVLRGMAYIAGVAPALAVNSHFFRPNMVALVKALLTHGANPNARIEKAPRLPGSGNTPRFSMAGATPFFLAVATGDVALLHVLVDGGADPLLPTAKNATPLMVAAGLGHLQDRTAEEEKNALEFAKFLLQRGADVNAVGENGYTALHGAAYVGADAIAQLLVAKGAQLEVEDIWGQTPLMLAESIIGPRLLDFTKKANGPHPSMANLLRQLGASPVAPVAQGSTPLPGNTSKSNQ